MKSLWPLKELSEIIEIERDQVLPREINGDDVYLGLEDIESGSGRILRYVQACKADLKSNKFRFQTEHILYGKLRPYLNKVALPEKNGVCSTDILPIRLKDSLIDRHFLAYLMRSEYFTQIATTRSSGANLPRISPEQLEKIRIPLPPREFQKKFSLALQKIESALEKRREAIRLLDDFLKSTFISMFGALLRLKSNITISYVAEDIIDYRGRTPPLCEEGIPHVTARQIKNGQINWEGTPYVTEATYAKYMTRGLPQVGDVLFTTEAPLGETAIVDVDRKFSLAQRIILIRPRKEKVNSIFLNYLLGLDLFRSNLLKFATGSTVKGISSANFQKVRLPLPKMEIQDRFSKIWSFTSELKQKMKSSETELQNFFNSLMQKAFRGELTIVKNEGL